MGRFLLHYRLVHAITPCEENKSFLEHVQMGEKLCGIKDDVLSSSMYTLDDLSDSMNNLTTSSLNCDVLDDHKFPDGVWNSSDSDDDITSVSTATNFEDPIQWSTTKKDTTRRTQKLLPSFTRCSLVEVDSSGTHESSVNISKHKKNKSKDGKKRSKKGTTLTSKNSNRNRTRGAT